MSDILPHTARDAAFSKPLSTSALLDRLATVKQMLEFLAAIEKLSDPLTSAAGLHEAFSLLAQLASVAGVDASLLNRVIQATNDPTVFNLLLAVVQFVAEAVSSSATAPMEANHAS
ncbi:MAG TPA: hypothetical protein VG713_08880 [Pirellulales bacterium]|nr:hypothetical protein [Pirellulales bacterium]